MEAVASWPRIHTASAKSIRGIFNDTFFHQVLPHVFIHRFRSQEIRLAIDSEPSRAFRELGRVSIVEMKR